MLTNYSLLNDFSKGETYCLVKMVQQLGKDDTYILLTFCDFQLFLLYDVLPVGVERQVVESCHSVQYQFFTRAHRFLICWLMKRGKTLLRLLPI